jgi:N-acyl-D-aspartate/D-glutamate deacylase
MQNTSRLLTSLALAGLVAVGSSCAPAESGGPSGATGSGPFDVVFTGGRVLDGTGNPWIFTDVGVRDGRIAALGDLSGADASERIDVSGLYVAPGFIDTHSHSSGGLMAEDRSHSQPLLAEGITTVMVNPDGGGMADMVEQQAALLEHGLGVNAAQFVPHGSVRRAAMGSENRPPTAEELQAMRDIVRAGMEAGAFGLSSGTFYAPGNFATNDEIIELARVVAEFGGAYQSHPRDESTYSVGVVAASEEVIDVGRQAGIPTVITHVKALGPLVWGKSEEMVANYVAAREEGVQVFTDQYPYNASSTGLTAALLPRWVESGGRDSLVARINDPELIDQIKEGMREGLRRRGGADRIQIARFEPDPSIEGQLLSDLAAAAGMDPIDYSLELFQEGGPGIVSYNMSEEDIQRFMVQDFNMTASDGAFPEFGVGVPHPRAYGAFPRKIRKYVIEEGVVSLSQAIRSMTSLPAQVFDIPERGLLVPGLVADVVVFDLATIRDNATFTDPHQISEGMVHVLVDGEFAIRDRDFTGAMAGQVLRKVPE